MKNPLFSTRIRGLKIELDGIYADQDILFHYNLFKTISHPLSVILDRQKIVEYEPLLREQGYTYGAYIRFGQMIKRTEYWKRDIEEEKFTTYFHMAPTIEQLMTDIVAFADAHPEFTEQPNDPKGDKFYV